MIPLPKRSLGSRLLDRHPLAIGQETAQVRWVRWVRCEYDCLTCICCVRSDDGDDATWSPTRTGPLDSEPQVACTPGRRLVRIHGPNPIDNLIDRGVLRATSDCLGKGHGRNHRLPPMLE